jgi:hypothetical protein
MPNSPDNEYSYSSVGKKLVHLHMKYM